MKSDTTSDRDSIPPAPQQAAVAQAALPTPATPAPAAATDPTMAASGVGVGGVGGGGGGRGVGVGGGRPRDAWHQLVYDYPRGDGIDEAEALWYRMLEIQRLSGLYNSARLNAALASGEYERFMPAKATLDLMNDCVSVRVEDLARLQKALREEDLRHERRYALKSVPVLKFLVP